MPKITYEEIERLLDKHYGKELQKSDYPVNLKFFTALNAVLDDAFTADELFSVVDFYSDVLLNKHPEVAILLQAERILGLCRLMSDDPITKRLPPEKREILAFAIWDAYCIQIYDEKRNLFLNGIVELGTPEEIIRHYESMKKRHQEYFPQPRQAQPAPRGEFGYSPNNPIGVTSIRNSYDFLKRLQAEDGKIIKFNRYGSSMNDNGAIIDIYQILVKRRKNLFFSETKSYMVFVNAYAQETSTVAPRGFKFI